MFVPIPPLVLALLYQQAAASAPLLADGKRPNRPLWRAIVLGVLIAAEFFISAEIALTTVLLAAIILVGHFAISLVAQPGESTFSAAAPDLPGRRRRHRCAPPGGSSRPHAPGPSIRIRGQGGRRHPGHPAEPHGLAFVARTIGMGPAEGPCDRACATARRCRRARSPIGRAPRPSPGLPAHSRCHQGRLLGPGCLDTRPDQLSILALPPRNHAHQRSPDPAS
jgi:hypothetical protein